MVFLHGNMASSQWWQPLLECAQNKTGQEALLIDLRGCGKSPYWKSDGDLSLEDLAEDLSQCMVENLAPSDDFVLVGHSLGGLLAAKLASQYKERVAGLYLLDPVGPHGVQFSDEMYAAIDAMKADRSLTETVIHSTIYNAQLGLEFKNQITDDAFKAVQNIGSEVLGVLKNVDLSEDMKSISAKTLLCWGEKDTIIPKEDVQVYLDFIKNSCFEEIQNQGHCWNVEDPKAMFDHLSSFIDSLE